MKLRINYPIFVAIILIIILSLFSLWNFPLAKKYVSLNQEYNNYKEEKEEEINELKNRLGNLEKEYGSLNSSYDSLEYEVGKTLEKIELYEKEIEDSMGWFRSNSIITENENEFHGKIIRLLKMHCLRISRGGCTIKLGCFDLVNSEFLNINYIDDSELTNEGDTLQPLIDFIGMGGGDCEDWSLFYKAEYNALLKECKNQNLDIKLEAWYSGSEEVSEKYWLNFNRLWYIEEVSSTLLKDGYVYPNIICGDLYDPNTNEINGHCMVAFTNQKIVSSLEFDSLVKSPIIEPQTGEFIGLINDESSEVYLLSKENYLDPPESNIHQVITDNDLFLFSEKEGGWLNYGLLKNELDQRKIKLFSHKNTNI